MGQARRRPVPRGVKQLKVPRGPFKIIEIPKKFGAGEGIRTLDPNLGKVVLYP
jgi:hypothetical protein